MIYAENILICISVPLLISLIFVRGNTGKFVASFIIGMAVCLISAYISGFIDLASHMGDEDTAIFISPIVDMERLILDMLGWAGATEEELRARGEIQTAFGETLSWDYLAYVREHPIGWDVPTEILCGSGDTLTSRETVEAFAREHGAALTVMEGGEHWFHTPEQMAFLDAWILGCQACLAADREDG